MLNASVYLSLIQVDHRPLDLLGDLVLPGLDQVPEPELVHLPLQQTPRELDAIQLGLIRWQEAQGLAHLGNVRARLSGTMDHQVV